ncbi:MAG: hypothetical protein JNL79_05035 [Myxococcales bacterium]|nr:hypothetical protein [Myxococcales bacterium]
MRWWFALVLLVPLSGCAPSVGARMQAITPRPWLPTLCTTCKPRRVETTAEASAPKPYWHGEWRPVLSTTTWLGEPLQGIDPYTLPAESVVDARIQKWVIQSVSDLDPDLPAVWDKCQASAAPLAEVVAKPSLDVLADAYGVYLGSLGPGAAVGPVETWATVESLRAIEIPKLRPRALDQLLATGESRLAGWSEHIVAWHLLEVTAGVPKDATPLVERAFAKQLAERVRRHLVKTLPAPLVDDVTTRARARVLAATRKVKPKPAP